MKIADLKNIHNRPDIYALAMQRHKEAGNEENDQADLITAMAFVWEETKEGYDFWNSINKDDFRPFNELYGNPETFTAEDVKEYAAFWINRLGSNNEIFETWLESRKPKTFQSELTELLKPYNQTTKVIEGLIISLHEKYSNNLTNK